jgi:hypothetical protein
MRKSSSFFLSPSKGVRTFIFISFKVIVARAGAGAGADVAGMAVAAVVPTRVSEIAEVDGKVIVAMRAIKGGAMRVGIDSVGERFSTSLTRASDIQTWILKLPPHPDHLSLLHLSIMSTLPVIKTDKNELSSLLKQDSKNSPED